MLLILAAHHRTNISATVLFWIAYVLTRPLGASLGDLLTQDKPFGGLALGASVTSLLFFATILLLVIREQVLVNRHGVAAKGAGPIGGRQRDYAWAAAATAAVTVAGLALSTLHPAASPVEVTQAAVDPGAGTATQPAKGKTTGQATRQIRPTTRLGNLSAFAAIVTDVKAKVAKNDLAGAKTRVKDLEVAWDDAEAGLKPRDSGKWHQLDNQIDAVLTALRASHPTQADDASTVATLMTTLNKFDGV
jgi:repeat uncharacterized protein DUF347